MCFHCFSFSDVPCVPGQFLLGLRSLGRTPGAALRALVSPRFWWHPGGLQFHLRPCSLCFASARGYNNSGHMTCGYRFATVACCWTKTLLPPWSLPACTSLCSKTGCRRWQGIWRTGCFLTWTAYGGVVHGPVWRAWEAAPAGSPRSGLRAYQTRAPKQTLTRMILLVRIAKRGPIF